LTNLDNYCLIDFAEIDRDGCESLRLATNEAKHHDGIIFIMVTEETVEQEYRRQQAAAEEQAGRRLQPPLQQIVPPVQWKLNGCMAEGMDGRAAGHAAEADMGREVLEGIGRLSLVDVNSCNHHWLRNK
ncbi:hypothetical protein GOODEAATRI_008935, partial [Goodea atripinnis]